MKIRGNTVGTTMPRPNWNQDDPRKADYIHNKPNVGRATEEGGIVFNDCSNNEATAQFATAFGSETKATGKASFVGGSKIDRSGASSKPTDSDWRYNEAVGEASKAIGMGAVAYARASNSLGYRTQTGYPNNTEAMDNRPEAVVYEGNAPFNLYDDDGNFIEDLYYELCDNCLFNEDNPDDDGVFSDSFTYEITQSGTFKFNISNESLGVATVVVTDANGETIVTDSYSKNQSKFVEFYIPPKVKKFTISASSDSGYVQVQCKLIQYFPGGNVGQGAAAFGSDTSACGNSSLATGYKTKAIGSGSFASGKDTIATGDYSHVQGKYNVEDTENKYAHIVGGGSSDTERSNIYTLDWDGNAWFRGAVYAHIGRELSYIGQPYGTLIGAEIFNDYQNNKAEANYSHAEGYKTKASGNSSHAEGLETTASGVASHSEGEGTVASGINAHAEGNYARAIGANSHAEGVEAIASGSSSHAEGGSTEASGNYSHAEGDTVEASGESSHAEGYSTQANGSQSHAEGRTSIASGARSHAEGLSTKASGANSHAEGNLTIASGSSSHAEGADTEAEGKWSHAEGRYTTAYGEKSHAEGYCTIAYGANSHVQGKFNIKDTDGNYAHIVGGGSSSSARSNIHTLDWKGNAWLQGAMTTNGADYAEFFEWADGNPNNEDRVGYVVSLDGEKIKLASHGDDVLGVISGTAAVLGDNSGDIWKKKYVTDDFGRIIYDMVEEFDTEIDPETNDEIQVSVGFYPHPRINPDFDSSIDYIPREERQEWDKVGMLGKLYVRDDGSCIVGGYGCVGEDGVLTNSNEPTNIRIMKRINDNIVFVLLK